MANPLTTEDVKVAENYMDNNNIDISPIDTEEKVYIEVVLEGENNKTKVVIRTKHDNIVFASKNDEILLEEAVEEVAATTNNTQPKENILDTITIKEIVEAIESVDFEEIANYGLNEKVGVGVGYGMKKSMEEGLLSDDLMNYTMMITAAASDARMAGVKLPVMSSNGSGNHGITAILPIVAYNNKKDECNPFLWR